MACPLDWLLYIDYLHIFIAIEDEEDIRAISNIDSQLLQGMLRQFSSSTVP
jgi:hypothetical protein